LGELLENGQTIIFYRNNVGGTWSEPIDIQVAEVNNDLSVVITKQNTVHLAWTDSSSRQLFYTQAPLYYANRVKSWAKPISLMSGVNNANLSLGTDQHLYITYTVPDSSSMSHGIFFIDSANDGLTWSIPRAF